MKIDRIVIGFIIFLSIPVLSQDSDSLIQRIDAYRVPFEQFYIRTRLTAYIDEKVDETAVYDAYMDGVEKSLVIQKEGMNRDMMILYSEEKLWLHLPGSRRPIRITPIQRLMGQASNGDIARVSYGEDYRAESKGMVTVQDIPCLQILLTVQKKSATYPRIVLYVRQKDCRPVEAEFYLLSGKHYKTATYDRYGISNGKILLEKMTIYDEVRKGRRTIFEYEGIREKKIAVKYFNKNYLVHVTDL
jgi:hypothetical protein